MRYFFLVIAQLFLQVSYAQLFDNQVNIDLVSKGIDFIYNVQPDSANRYITKLEKRLPGHPVVPMMQALILLWKHIPLVTTEGVFAQFEGYLEQTIARANAMDGGKQQHPEAIFFEMTARGLLAEYYADDGRYMKALSEANKTYDLIKKGFDLSGRIPDFLLTTGIYNYFREKYPERHPVYTPFLWLFKSGDVELGLRQINQATQKGVLTKVEASIYMAYIYLRYEYQPKKAQSYLWSLAKKYPNNLYIRCILLESLVTGDDFKQVPKAYLQGLRDNPRPYYKMAGESFTGFYQEKIAGNDEQAMRSYQQAVATGTAIPGHGNHYRGMAYLGLGRIAVRQGKTDEAKTYLEEVIDNSDSEDLEKEARTLLNRLP